MKKPKGKLTFASALTAVGAMISLSSCAVYDAPPINDPSPDVYGPPEYFETEDPDEPMQTDYGPPLIIDDDIDEPGEEVYGPPEWFDGDTDEPIETVYGPPEWFSHDDGDDIQQPMEPVYGPPPDDVIDDIDQPMGDVYGPPEIDNGEKP